MTINENNKYSRRDILKFGSLLIPAVLLSSCGKFLKKNISTDSNVLGISTQNATSTHTPEPTSTPTKTPEVWKLTIPQRIDLMSKPDLFMELQGKNTTKIITSQYDENQYKNMDREAHRNNGCGQATLATIIKMCEYLNTGLVPNITIADIYKSLDAVEFTDSKGFTTKIITANDMMYFSGLSDATKIVASKYISKIELLTPDYGAKDTRILPQDDWPDVLSKTQKICENGGFGILGGLKYGTGHIVLGTNVNVDGTATITDPYVGITNSNVVIKDFFEKMIDPTNLSLGEQPGLISIVGLSI